MSDSSKHRRHLFHKPWLDEKRVCLTSSDKGVDVKGVNITENEGVGTPVTAEHSGHLDDLTFGQLSVLFLFVLDQNTSIIGVISSYV